MTDDSIIIRKRKAPCASSVSDAVTLIPKPESPNLCLHRIAFTHRRTIRRLIF